MGIWTRPGGSGTGVARTQGGAADAVRSRAGGDSQSTRPPVPRQRPSGRPSRTAAAAFFAAVVLTVAALAALGAELALAYRTPAPAPAGRAAEHIALVERFYAESWNRNAWLGLPRYVAEDHAYHDPSLPEAAAGLVGIAHVVAGLRRALPDLTLALDEIVASGDRVAVRSCEPVGNREVPVWCFGGIGAQSNHGRRTR